MSSTFWLKLKEAKFIDNSSVLFSSPVKTNPVWQELRMWKSYLMPLDYVLFLTQTRNFSTSFYVKYLQNYTESPRKEEIQPDYIQGLLVI